VTKKDDAQSAGEQGARPPGRARRAGARVKAAARRFEQSPKLVIATKLARELLPGDSRFGDPLSTAGGEQPQVVGRRLAELTADRPGVLREAGLSALQVWQSISEAQGRGRGTGELAVVFTDLVEFSNWALQAGDDAALDFLRDVGQAIEPPVKDHGGEMVKRLGDGMMAVFEDPQGALDALFEARSRLDGVDVEGYDPRIRAGMHVGRPRRLGGDYLGVDVNVAARVADEAGADEILLSGQALEHLETSALEVEEKGLVRIKGVPEDVTSFSVSRGR
jgi:class 3 adenylate cyclase